MPAITAWPLPTWLHAPCCAAQVLQLHNNSLSGTLAPEWGLPQSLVEFTLADNPGLGGPLPNATWSLPNLRLAALWGCNFTGSLPSSWEVNPAAVVAVLPQEGEGFCGEVGKRTGGWVGGCTGGQAGAWARGWLGCFCKW